MFSLEPSNIPVQNFTKKVIFNSKIKCCTKKRIFLNEVVGVKTTKLFNKYIDVKRWLLILLVNYISSS